jgi:hypothetical protein
MRVIVASVFFLSFLLPTHAVEDSCHLLSQITLKEDAIDEKAHLYAKAQVEVGGIVEIGKRIYVVSDKKSKMIDIFERSSENHTYTRVAKGVDLSNGNQVFSCLFPDFEGMAFDRSEIPPALYVIGSNSISRKRRTPTNNPLDSLTQPRCAGVMVQLNVAEEAISHAAFTEIKDFLGSELTGNTARDKISILDFDGNTIQKEPNLLLPFMYIPAKENGLDIEGIAVTATRLYIGFRGPIIDTYYTPIVIANKSKDKWNDEKELLFLNLGGLGIRDIAYDAQVDKFLIIAGPVGEHRKPFILYQWDGSATEPGDDLKQICELTGNPEGVFIRRADPMESYIQFDILIAHDNEDEADGGRLPFRIERREAISAK